MNRRALLRFLGLAPAGLPMLAAAVQSHAGASGFIGEFTALPLQISVIDPTMDWRFSEPVVPLPGGQSIPVRMKAHSSGAAARRGDDQEQTFDGRTGDWS